MRCWIVAYETKGWWFFHSLIATETFEAESLAEAKKIAEKNAKDTGWRIAVIKEKVQGIPVVVYPKAEER